MSTAAQVDAKKGTIGRDEALRMARGAEEIYATKGKTVHHLDLRAQKATDDEIAALIIGPSGNLRAPTLRVGKALVVGFDEATYQEMLG